MPGQLHVLRHQRGRTGLRPLTGGFDAQARPCSVVHNGRVVDHPNGGPDLARALCVPQSLRAASVTEPPESRSDDDREPRSCHARGGNACELEARLPTAWRT